MKLFKSSDNEIVVDNLNTNAPMPSMLTIRELALECKDIGVSEYYIRLAVKQNKFPTVTIGRKILINRDIFIKHLNGIKFS